MFFFRRKPVPKEPTSSSQAVQQLEMLYTNYINYLLPKVLAVLERSIPDTDVGKKGELSKIRSSLIQKKPLIAASLAATFIQSLDPSQYQRYDTSQNIARFEATESLLRIIKSSSLTPENKLEKFADVYAKTAQKTILGSKRLFGIRGEKVAITNQTNQLLNWYDKLKKGLSIQPKKIH